MKSSLTIIGLLIFSSSTFATTTDILNLPLSGDQTTYERPSFHFKKPLVIPFNLFTEKQIQTIESQNADAKFGFTVTFIDGKATRAVTPLESTLLNQTDYQAAVRVALPEGVWRSNGTSPDVSFCQMHLYLDGKKNDEGYTVQPERDQIPNSEANYYPQNLSVNWGRIKTEGFGFFYILRPEERPNEITGGARSKELYSLNCLRHAKDTRPINVSDFLKAIGTDTVEVTKTK